VVWINRTATAWLGHASEALIGRPLVELLSTASRVRWETALADLTGCERVSDVELELGAADGTTVPVSASAGRVAGPGGCIRVTMVALRDRHEADERAAALPQALARRAIEVERAHRELDALSYAVSRDLREPVRAIDALARRLYDEHAARLDDGGQR